MATKAEKYIRFDAADYLDGIEDAATYLQIALEESEDHPTADPRAPRDHPPLGQDRGGVHIGTQSRFDLAQIVEFGRIKDVGHVADHRNCGA